MAGLNEMYPSMPQLGGWAAGEMQGQQYLDAQKNTQINQQAALQDLWKRQQMDPLDIQGKQLSNEGIFQDNRGKTIDANTKDYEWQMRQHFQSQEYQKKLDEYVKSHDAASLEKMVYAVRMGMLSSNPKEREMAMRLHPYIGTVADKLAEIKATGDQSVRVANVHEAGQNNRQQLALQEKSKKFKEGLTADLTRAGGNPVNQYSVITRYLSVAEPGSQEAAELTKQRDALYPVVKAALQRSGPNLTLDPVTRQLVENQAGPAPLPDPRQNQWKPPAGWSANN